MVTAPGKRPASIPNLEAKPGSANGTATARLWESRTPPQHTAKRRASPTQVRPSSHLNTHTTHTADLTTSPSMWCNLTLSRTINPAVGADLLAQQSLVSSGRCPSVSTPEESVPTCPADASFRCSMCMGLRVHQMKQHTSRTNVAYITSFVVRCYSHGHFCTSARLAPPTRWKGRSPRATYGGP